MNNDDYLPPLVRGYVERAVPAGARHAERVRISQDGEMRQRPGGRWLPFRATQEFAVQEVAFAWRARFPVAPGVWLRVVDSYASGSGALEVRLWGLVPLRRSHGRDVAKGQAMRYLGELVWAPHALAANEKLIWRAVDATRVELATEVADREVSVRLRFDAAGDIVAMEADERPRERDEPAPWAGSFADYATVGGVRIPRRAEGAWLLPEGRFTYFRCTVTSLELVGESG